MSVSETMPLARIDRTIVTAFYKALGKKVILTAHNVDVDERDGRSGRLGRYSLRLMYRMVDHILVHTEKMKTEMEREFGVSGKKITVIPYGMNTVAPWSDVTRPQARKELGMAGHEKIVLFFGTIAPYKGLEYLVEAIAMLRDRGWEDVRLVIAGDVKNRAARGYWEQIEQLIEKRELGSCVRKEVRFIPDNEVELFFKAADVCALPYVSIYQSGVLFLSYRYGLPVVATDVGSLKEDVIERRTGFVCRPVDPADVARALEDYFRSPLFANADRTRQDIVTLVEETHSWRAITATIAHIYETMQPGAQRAAR